MENDISCEPVYDIFRLQVNKKESNETVSFFDFSNIDWHGSATISTLVLIAGKIVVFLVSFVVAKLHYTVKRSRDKQRVDEKEQGRELDEVKPLRLTSENYASEEEDGYEYDAPFGNYRGGSNRCKPTANLIRHDSRTMSLNRNCR